MSEVLSQNQIDELLSDILVGKVEKKDFESNNDKKIKNYDFKNPKKFSKEQFKLLRSVYENFARHFSSYLSGILRVSCQIKVSTIDEHPYFEYNNALPDSVLLGIYNLKPLDGTVLVNISNSITFTIIERLLGGNGDGIPLEHDYTEIEIALMGKIMKQIEKNIKDSWLNFVDADIEPELKKIETNARLMQSMSMDEAVVILIMEINIKSIKGTISVCMPIINLEPLLEKAGQSMYSVQRKTDASKEIQNKEAIMTHINDTEIEMVGIFGKTVLTFKEILDLKEGYIIKLNQHVDSNVKLCIGDKTRFLGVPGIVKNKKHIKIVNVL